MRAWRLLAVTVVDSTVASLHTPPHIHPQHTQTRSARTDRFDARDGVAAERREERRRSQPVTRMRCVQLHRHPLQHHSHVSTSPRVQSCMRDGRHVELFFVFLFFFSSFFFCWSLSHSSPSDRLHSRASASASRSICRTYLRSSFRLARTIRCQPVDRPAERRPAALPAGVALLGPIGPLHSLGRR